jgi:hypothetical protein
LSTAIDALTAKAIQTVSRSPCTAFEC